MKSIAENYVQSWLRNLKSVRSVPLISNRFWVTSLFFWRGFFPSILMKEILFPEHTCVSAGHIFNFLTITPPCSFKGDIKTCSAKVRSYRTIMSLPCNNSLLLKTVRILQHLKSLRFPKQDKDERGRMHRETNPLMKTVVWETTKKYIFQTSDTIIISNPIKHFIKMWR